MIINSTPSAITCRLDDGREVKFYGEWTLEPKFYLDLNNVMHIETNKCLSSKDAAHAMNNLLRFAKERGWEIEVADYEDK